MRLDLGSYVQMTELADYIVPFTIRAVSELGVADLLAGGPLPVETLADRTGTHAPSLLRALRALASKGVFAETEPGVFDLTPLAQPLRGDHPLSLRDAYPLLASDIDGWAHFDHSVRTGEASFDVVHDLDYWTYLAQHPRDSERVDASMAAINTLHLRTVLPAYGWGGLETLVDVGGGNGSFLVGILAKFKQLRGTLVDLPHVVAAAGAAAERAGVADRVTVVPGSFFDPLPEGADAYVLKTVLPGFDDADAVRILRRVREAMAPHSRLVLLEAVITDDDAFDAAKLVDVHTLMLTGSSHRDVDQLTGVLRKADLTLCSVRNTAALTVIEARPADLPGPETSEVDQ